MWGLWAKFAKLSSAEIVAGLAWAIAAGLLRYRLPFGVDHGDEAFYSAMPYSFLLGNRPYVDELAMHQNAGLLLLPFFKVYLAIAHSTDGIILFNRYLYFVHALFCSYTAFRFTLRVSRLSTALWAAALVVSFAYYNLFALSYNTFGAFGFFCGCLWAATALLEERPGPRLFGACLFFLSAGFAYPVLAVVVIPYGVLLLIALHRKRSRTAFRSGLLGLASGLLVGALLLVPWALWIGKDNFQRLIGFSQGMGYAKANALRKLDLFHSYAWLRWHWFLLAFAALLGLAPLACAYLKRSPWLFALASAVGLLVCYWSSQLYCVDAPTPATVFLLTVPTLAPVCVALNRDWRRGRFVLALLWAPSVLSMLSVAYASANSFHSASLGALGALLAGVICFSAYLDTRAAQAPQNQRGYELVLAAFFAACLVIQVHSLFAVVYAKEGVFSANNTRVRFGPLRGTYATRSEAELAVAVDRDLKSLAGGAESLTIFDDFATGYLSTRLRPRTFTQWIIWCMRPAYTKRLMQRTFGTTQRLPDVVLKIRQKPASQTYWQKYEKSHYRVAIDRPEFDYMILRRKGLPPQ